MNLQEAIVAKGFNYVNTLEIPNNLVFSRDDISKGHLFRKRYKCFPSTANYRIKLSNQDRILDYLKAYEFFVFDLDSDYNHDLHSFTVQMYSDVLSAVIVMVASDDTLIKVANQGVGTSTHDFGAAISSSFNRITEEDNKHIHITISYDISLANTREFISKFSKEFENKNTETANKINIFEKEGYDMTLNSYELDCHSLDIAKHYNDDFADVDVRLREWAVDFKSKNNRLAFLNGNAGAGKTNYIQNLMKSIPNVRKIYIPPYFVQSIADPDFFGFIKRYSGSLLIIEDAEKILVSREGAEENPAISVLLNLTDGIMAKILNFKIICTFNSDENNIDSALKRPGRLFLKYKFDELSRQKTYNLHMEVYGTPPPKEQMTLAEIYNNKDNGAKMKEHRTIGFGG